MAHITLQMRHFPWPQILAFLALLAAIVMASNADTNPLSSAQINSERTERVTAPAVDPPENTAPKVSAPVTPKVVDYRVVWTEVRGFNPFTIPVEEGLYNGEAPNGYSYIPGDPSSLPGNALYALKVFPELWMWNAEETPGILAAIARAKTDERVMLLAVRTDYDEKREDGGFRREVRIALSVDGGGVWCKLNALPRGVDGATFHVRIHTQQTSVNLYAHDTRAGIHWWTTTIDKNVLPCS